MIPAAKLWALVILGFAPSPVRMWRPARTLARVPKLGAKHFIRTIVEDDLASGRHSEIVTRFPPEPNGAEPARKHARRAKSYYAHYQT